METPQSTGLVRGWTFRIMLLVASVTFFLGAMAHTHDRWQFSRQGVPATIEVAYSNQKAPSTWSAYEGQLRSMFVVRVKTSDGPATLGSLFLEQGVINRLLSGQQEQIIYVKDNLQRFMMKSDPLPPYGVWQLLGGILFFMLFLYSLRLR